jgi:aspartyl-tRNA(Asn)/glutamyl-tRNA(Gln) amidotransferase subunit A
MSLTELTLNEAREKLRNRECSSVELTRAFLDRIERLEPQIGAYINVFPEKALEQAEKADQRLSRGEGGPLTGIPLAVKDVISTKGLPTTCASRMLADYLPPYDATVITRLEEQGYVLLGKTNLDEFAMGSSTENSALQTTRNPWDGEAVPGGSSGGSAAAVAAAECLGALGSDTGGSIRQPAAHCGVVGLKPTYGRVSRYGLVAYASSLDQIGPLSKTVADSALLLQAIAGHDSRDSTSAPREVPDYLGDLERGVQGLRIGLPREYFIKEGLEPEVEKAVGGAVKTLEAQGASFQEIALPHTAYAVAVYYIIAMAEASSNLARYDGVKYGFREPESRGLLEMYQKTRAQGFGPEVIRRIMLGTYVLSAGYYDAYYRKASQVRTLIIRDFQEAFNKVDLILTPVAPTPAFRRGEKTSDPLQMYLTDIFTISANLAGIPGLSLPCGFSPGGLPIGFQILGNYFEEARLLQAGQAFEQATDYHLRRPAL